MPTTYTASQIKRLVMDQINKIKGLSSNFSTFDSDEAFDEAVRECGFELPATTDDDVSLKYQWLIHRMRRWYMGRLWEQYILRFKTGDLEAQHITKQLENICKIMDEQFGAAKSQPETAHLFTNADIVFGDGALVIDTGIIEDRIGTSTEDRT